MICISATSRVLFSPGEWLRVEAGSVVERVRLRRLSGGRRVTQKELDVDRTGSQLKPNQLASGAVHC